MKKLLLYTLAIIVPIFAMAQQTDTLDSSTPTMLKWGAIKVRSFPTNAKVFIDDTYVGRTPLKMPVPAGEHKLNVRKKKWPNAHRHQSIYINEGRTTSKKVILDPSYGCEFVIMGGPTITIGAGSYYGSLTLQGIYGFRFNQRWILGLGVALATEWGGIIRNGEKCDPGLLPRPFFSGPVGIYLQRDFINPCKACTPFLAFSAGYDFATQHTVSHSRTHRVYKGSYWYDESFECCSRQYKISGPYCNAQLGIRLGDPSIRDIQHQISLGYRYGTAPYALYGYNEDYCLYGPIKNIGIHQIAIHYTVYFSVKMK